MIGKLMIKSDERGRLVEVFHFFKPTIGNVIFLTTKPGAVRANHYHTRKIEHFCVIEGQAKIRLRNRATNEIKEYDVSGEAPEIVEMPINWTHNIQNTGEGEMKLLVWANEMFSPDDPDAYPEEV